MAKILFKNAGHTLTMAGAAKKGGRNVKEEDLSRILQPAWVSENGRITWIGSEKDLPAGKYDEEVDLCARDVVPAFVECHTHLAFVGNRSEEFEWRQQGVSYQEIAARGGGIISTVKSTRSSNEEALLWVMQERADRFVEQGVTTLEIKSGYGLDLENEIKSLKMAGKVKGPRIVRTFLGPHSKPPEYKTVDEYFEFVMEKLLPEIAKKKLAERADIFIEKGFFSAEQGERYFKKAKSLGLDVTAHVEQLSNSGGTAVALKNQAVSVDHVVELKPEEITSLAKSESVAVLLPASDFYLKIKYPKARDLIDQGACVALSTDFNPGTSPTQDLSFVGVLARLEMKMSLPEVLCAWTFGAAKALNKQAMLGSLEVGKQCDFVCLDNNWENLFYSVGSRPVANVWKEGRKLFEKKF